MPFWSRTENDTAPAPQNVPPGYGPPPYQQNCYADGSFYAGNYPGLPGNVYQQQQQPYPAQHQQQQQPPQQGQQGEMEGNNKYAPQEQDEDLPMDLGDLTDIFSFEFMRGRPIWNFILAILWCIGLPILLYHILKPYLGQVLAMVVASAPPLLIVIGRMVRQRQFDILGMIAGLAFLISGIVSIAEPTEQVEAICEGIVPLLVGVFCVVSLIPIKIGSYELRPVIYQLTNQVMPRSDAAEDLAAQDEQRLNGKKRPATKQEKLDWAYTNMARFRQDMRIMTAAWGIMLIVGFFIKLIVVLTNTDLGLAALAGYLIFGLGALVVMIFTWFYTKISKGHLKEDVAFWREQQEPRPLDSSTEAAHNLNWGAQSMTNAWGQVMPL
ncbi:hypothetical protein BDB00DRAFT_858748 [Zychaea mexicana]|uniref:uncharacterized protein n=1 Tax=Zychaea mexicana TaxID=64656 RepID=UPI0022FEFE48|nr:uncharacterized protein BDB00DRAFT_858748 [Zychaea mexicana]KAI9479480.1 hypothetical protein BDB00DRAFT_858748 [Zychaea mexicana]